MFYETPTAKTYFDLCEIALISYFVNEEDNSIDETSLLIIFKSGHGTRLYCNTEENAENVFNDIKRKLKDLYE